MSLILNRTYDDSDDHWSVCCESTYVGSILFNRHRPEQSWGWSITVHDPSPGIAKFGMATTRDEAMTQFREAWDRYRAWLGDARWQRWVEHMAMVEARSLIWKRRKAGEEPGGY